MGTESIVIEKEFWDEKKTKLKSETWYKNNKIHRTDGPAEQIWYKNGQKGYEAWYINDKSHRLDGPALQSWYENGQKGYESWCKDGKYHRLDGPAYQSWCEDGKLKNNNILLMVNNILKKNLIN